MLVIKNNIMSENAARHLGDSYDALARSVERLSSGLRINTAMDDAAGLAVRELMRADIAVLKQGSRNARDGISMLQTFEGALGAIDQILIRMKEISEQAATGSYSSKQREIMDNEFQQMAAEIDRIATKTEFNTVKMLMGTSALSATMGSGSTAVTIHFGQDTSGNNSEIDVNAVDVRRASLNLDSGSVSLRTAQAAKSALTTISTAIMTKDSARAMFGYMMNRLQSTDNVLNITAENMQASESRVSDVDVATEMATMTRNQVLANAGVSMLSQANGMPQMALQLLR
jgi:flagellin